VVPDVRRGAKGGCVMANFTKGPRAPRWTPQEDALVRWLYPRRSKHGALARALPHRTWEAIALRAGKLGAGRWRRKWTADEDRVLVREWGEVTQRVLRAKLRGRTWGAIVERAGDLGLPMGVPQGWETLTAAARRLGYATATLRALLARRGITTKRWVGRGGTRPFTIVEATCATEAVEAELEERRRIETIADAARARGVGEQNLRRALLLMGAYTVGQRGVPVVLPAKVYDAAAARCRRAS
jgi:hypothetical protein